MTETRARARPRDRKQQIVAAAAEKFRMSGYHNVGMIDIAEAVGITGPAVYRHFTGKQDLLLATLQHAIEQFAPVYAQPYDDLGATLDAVAAATLQRRDAGLLWEREVTHLRPADRRKLQVRYVESVQPLRDAIARARPDLCADDVDLLLWTIQAVFASLTYQSIKLDPGRLRSHAIEAAQAACMTSEIPVPTPPGGEHRQRPAQRLLPTARREAVLLAAVRLFAEHGYQAVGMDDIGAAAGIAGPSLYHHFVSKSAILVAALSRCLEAMLFDLFAALDAAQDAEHALDLVLRSFVRINVEHGDSMGSLLHEIISVPADEREAVRRLQRDYVSEWTALLVLSRPELSEAEARMLVLAAQTVIGILPRIRHLRARPALREELIVVGRAVLGLPGDRHSSVDGHLTELP
jgi:AcrR family transcriptional regulator